MHELGDKFRPEFDFGPDIVDYILILAVAILISKTIL